MQLAANLSMLYADLPVPQRFAAAVADGFRYVEILQPYDNSPDWYAQQLDRHGLQLVLINTPSLPPDYPVGLAAQPDAGSAFQAAIQQAAAVCRATGCSSVHVLAGKVDAQYSRQSQRQALHENLRWACAHYPELTWHLEALNRTDVPDYFYSWPEQVAHELSALDGCNVGMQFDFYHVVKEGLAVAAQLERYFPYVRHVQVAGSPQRHEPDVSQDGLLAGFERLHALGYQGYIGLEYRPASDPGQGLSWLAPLLERQLVQR